MLAATKQRYDLFVKCFAAGMFKNGTEAAIEAKFAEGSARQTAHRLLSNDYIKAEVAKLRGKLVIKHEITAERILKEYAKIGFSNIQDLTDEEGRLKKISDIGRDNMAAVQSIKFKGVGKKQTVEFKLYSKTAALDSLGKNLGIFEKDNFQKGVGKTIADIFAIVAAQRRTKNVDSTISCGKTLPGEVAV